MIILCLYTKPRRKYQKNKKNKDTTPYSIYTNHQISQKSRKISSLALLKNVNIAAES